jgi:hypothetical protein
MWMRRRPGTPRAVVAVAALLAVLSGPVAAGEGPGLPALLRLLPDASETTTSAPVFGYVDLAAIAAAAGVEPPGSDAEFAALDDARRAAWIDAMRRIQSGPTEVLGYPMGIGQRAVGSVEALGINWFEIDAAMTFWQPPSTVTVIAGGAGFADPAKIGAALTARGFSERQLDGFAVWHRLDDNAMALGQKDDLAEGDFLVGRLPRASRVAVKDGIVVHASNWPAIGVVAATESGKAAGSPAGRLSAAILGGIEEATGARLLQATAFMLRDIGSAEDPGGIFSQFITAPSFDLESLRKAIEPEMPGPRLPLYPLALIADMQDGADQLAVIALPFPDRESADEAATVLADRLLAWSPGDGTAPLLDQVRGTIEKRVVERDDVAGATFATFISTIAAGEEERKVVSALADAAGGAIAIVAVRYPSAAAGDAVKAGAVFRIWMAGIYRRAFTPLAAP